MPLQAAGTGVDVAELDEIVDDAVPPNVTSWMSLNSRKPIWAKAGETAITTNKATTVNSTRIRYFMRYPLP